MLLILKSRSLCQVLPRAHIRSQSLTTSALLPAMTSLRRLRRLRPASTHHRTSLHLPAVRWEHLSRSSVATSTLATYKYSLTALTFQVFFYMLRSSMGLSSLGLQLRYRAYRAAAVILLKSSGLWLAIK